MSKIRLSSEEIQSLNLFEKLTGAKAHDMLSSEDVLCFLVNKKDMGLAIGKKGVNIEKVKKAFNTKILIIEYSDEMKELVRNIFHGADLKDVRVSASSGGKNLVVKAPRQSRRNIIGPGGERIKLARKLLDRYYGLKDVIIEST